MMRWVDLPPVWLAGFIALAWGQAALWPMPSALPLPLLGAVLALVGFGLLGLALVQMVRARTTFIPREHPKSLMTSGVFALSRNPIYLGDALVLAGAVLYFEAWPSLVLVPIFMWLISWRFIEGEEAVLRAEFGKEFTSYERETRRWL